MADGIGQIPTPVMERLAAAAAAEPYESVSCAFVSYGSCAKDLADGWKYRSRLWYGVNLSPSPAPFGGGGSGWDFWKSALEKDANGKGLFHSLIASFLFACVGFMILVCMHNGVVFAQFTNSCGM